MAEFKIVITGNTSGQVQIKSSVPMPATDCALILSQMITNLLVQDSSQRALLVDPRRAGGVKIETS